MFWFHSTEFVLFQLMLVGIYRTQRKQNNDFFLLLRYCTLRVRCIELFLFFAKFFVVWCCNLKTCIFAQIFCAKAIFSIIIHNNNAQKLYVHILELVAVIRLLIWGGDMESKIAKGTFFFSLLGGAGGRRGKSTST